MGGSNDRYGRTRNRLLSRGRGGKRQEKFALMPVRNMRSVGLGLAEGVGSIPQAASVETGQTFGKHLIFAGICHIGNLHILQ